MRKIFILVSLSVFVTKPALACDLKNVLFGTSASHVVDQYDFNPLETEIGEVPKKGEFSIREFGNVVCKNLPDGSFIEFSFIDDSLVKVKIENNSRSQPVLDELKKIFGESDDKDRKKSPDGKTKVAMWDIGEKMSVLYMLGNDPKGGTVESVDISSKMHHALFQDIVEQKNKAIDKYLQENNLGKYNTSYKGGSSSSGGNSGASGGSYDPYALEKLKDGYDKANEAWKEKNQDNPRKGR
ncbi:MAG: hypothetical protein PQ612_10080 [Rickettsiales bacterium]|nr:hypothetical protein [Pseudomonadota bacterium]MDA0967600.1 hypothetical protein [Pseudomonadota bacterium]MDG4544371.1 hypothetical protein [Rickettsiales bacterium]MDG4546501.1 hypothetical protein [Rickettsiales bacterium]MDG4548663.1 hypothetical protein [Rickettsiales bacterium]